MLLRYLKSYICNSVAELRNKKSGYGKYAETNVSEFWAETVTKAIHGKSDKYTKKVKEICKKYKL